MLIRGCFGVFMTSLAEGFVEGNAGSDAHVVGTDPAAYWNGKEEITSFLHEPVQTASFVSQNQGNWNAEIRLPQWPPGLAGKAEDPVSALFQQIDGGDSVPGARDLNVGRCAGAGFDCRRTDPGSPALWQNHAIGTRDLSRAQDGAEVARVFDPIQDENQSWGARLCEEIFDGKRGHFRNVTENALVFLAFGLSIKPGLVFERDLDVPFTAKVNESLNSRIPLPALNTDPLDPGSIGPESLINRMDPIQ